MEKPIKVLAIVYQLKPAGLENRLMDIIRNIDQNRVQIDVFTYQLEQGVYDDEVRALGGIVYYNPALTVKNMFWYVKYFRDFLKNHPEYKIIHAHQDAWCSVFCKGAYLAGVPVRIAHSRTAISSNSLGNTAKNLIKLPTKKYANYYFAVSEKAGRWLYGDKFFDQHKVQVWPNAIDAEKFYYDENIRDRIRNNNGWDNCFVIMHVGNFTYPKNHPFLLKVFSKIHDRCPDAILVLAGDGDRKVINEYINELNIQDCVKLLGSRRDINELLQGADVFVFPSIFEGLPGALVEAQASGIPCVLSDTIAHEVYINPNIKVLSLNEEPENWADEIVRLKGVIHIKSKSYITAKSFDIKSLTNKLCDFYEKAFNKGVEES